MVLTFRWAWLAVVAAIVLIQTLYKKLDLTMALNGALVGLVAITTEPSAATLGLAAIIGSIGGILVAVTVPMLDKLKIDDVASAIPVHLICGVWGTIAAAFQ